MNSETQNNKIHYLYRIINKINGKIYIGQTVQPDKRWYQHKSMATQEHPVMAISCAIKKYGNEAFEFEIIASCKTWDDTNEIETLLVSQYNSLVPNGYNVSLGGFNAPKSEIWLKSMRDWHASLSLEERNEISEKQRQATIKQIETQGHPAQGNKWTDEQKANLSIALKALDKEAIYTEEVRRNMSEAHVGIKDTEETKNKKSESAKIAWGQRISYNGIKCNAPGCEVSGKAKYKIIEGIRYCNKHGLRLLRYGCLDRIKY